MHWIAGVPLSDRTGNIPDTVLGDCSLVCRAATEPDAQIVLMIV
jgi:hypothetical protein